MYMHTYIYIVSVVIYLHIYFIELIVYSLFMKIFHLVCIHIYRLLE